MRWMRLSIVGIAALACVVSTNAEPIGDGDWPQWRGPTRDGRAVGEKWPASIDESALKLAWRVELGPSYSGPIVAGDRVFTTETRDEAVEVVTAFNRSTGERDWSVDWPGAMRVPFFAAANGSWIRATPCTDGETLYVVGIRDVIVALDCKTGEERWRVDFPVEKSSEVPPFGAASSPQVVDGMLYAQSGGGFSKINAATGEVVWTVQAGRGAMSGGAFSSPYIGKVNDADVALVQSRAELKGVDPETGSVLWTQPIEAFRGMNILTPTVYRGDFFTSAHTGRSQLWRRSSAEPERLEQVWSNKSQAYMSSPVVVGDHVYMHLRNQRVQCLDLRTGEEAWRSRPFGKYQSMVVLDDRVLALDSGGELILFSATPDEFEVLERRRISDDETWAYLAVCGGQVFVRELNALAAYEWR